MSLERFPAKDYRLVQNSYHEATGRGDFSSVPELVPTTQTAMNYTAPGQIPPRKGRKVAIFIVSALLGFSFYKVWDSYFRYESFGVVESDIIGVYSPIEGFVDEMQVREGGTVRQGDIVSRVVSSDDQRSLQKIEDEIQLARSDLESKMDVLRVDSNRNSDALLQIQGQLAEAKGVLGELNSKLTFQKSELGRLTALMRQDAASSQEFDSARIAVQSTKELIASKKLQINSLTQREKDLMAIIGRDSSAQIQPLEDRITYLTNERSRIQQKIDEGVIRSPATGIVSGIQKRRGEKIGAEPLFTVVVSNTADMVLFYDPADELPQLFESIKVYSPSIGKVVTAEVSAISKTAITVPDQIKRYYTADQKAVKVYLEPKDVNINSFIVGSIVKRPSSVDLLKNSMKVVKGIFGGLGVTEAIASLKQ